MFVCQITLSDCHSLKGWLMLCKLSNTLEVSKMVGLPFAQSGNKTIAFFNVKLQSMIISKKYYSTK